jgi:DNA-binding transcriptional LysR family regulator
MREGLEPKLSLSIDAMYPMNLLTAAVGSFRSAFPYTPLRLQVDVLGAVIEPVLQGTHQIAVIGTLPIVPESMHSEPLLDVPMVTVVAPMHPLASYTGVIPISELKKHVQLVLTDRSKLTEGKSYGVFSQNAWGLADLGAKHAFLRAGFGFGHMPKFMVEDDIARGRLSAIRIEMPGVANMLMAMHAAYRKEAPPGPAGRWLIQSLKRRAAESLRKMPGARRKRATRR